MTNTDLEFGVMGHTFGAGASPEALEQIVTVAECGGFDAYWVGDHITFPREIPDTYPFSKTGKSPFDISQDAYDAFQTLAYLGHVTDEIQLGTNACIVPYRHPAVLLRNVFTLEALSESRFEFGAAPGWMETEFEVLDVPFEDRGRWFDEFFAIFEQARESGTVSFEGELFSIQETGFYPIPDFGRPPVWIGGRSGAAIRRVGEFGDGWTIFWDRPEQIRKTKSRIMNAWTDFNREGSPEIAVVRPVHIGTNTDMDLDRPLVGEPASIISDIEAYREAGVTRIVIDFFNRDPDDHVHQIERFADEVISHV